MINIKIKRVYYYFITFVLIFFLCNLLLILFAKKINPKLITISKDTLKKNIYNELAKSSSNIISNIDTNDLIIIDRNSDDEILYATYNLPKCYEVLNKISGSLNKSRFIKEMYLHIPLFMFNNYAIFANLGPTINVKINYLEMSLSNIYTKITDYGMNNALLEMYVSINITGRIITPVNQIDETIKYDMLISSMIINGRIPSFYGGMISATSNYFDIPILL